MKNKKSIIILALVIIPGVIASSYFFGKNDDDNRNKEIKKQEAEIKGARGIYVLDSKRGENRDANIRDYDFIDGYVWRMRWSDFEISEGVYDFSKVDDIIAKVQRVDKKLTLLLGGAMNAEPTYIANRQGVITWQDQSIHAKRAVPWEPYLLQRFKVFSEAMANHQVKDANGKLMPLRDHPTLANINFGVAGLGEIRERGFSISNFPNYSRDNFTNSVKNSLHAQTDKFPNKFVYIGLYNINDKIFSPNLWEHIQINILNEFDGIKNPRVGFWQDNMAARKNLATGVVTGYPAIAFATPLYESKNSTFIMMQALQGWKHPFANPDKVANASPFDGIKYAYETFGAKYFELYAVDIDNKDYWPMFQEWHDLLNAK